MKLFLLIKNGVVVGKGRATQPQPSSADIDEWRECTQDLIEQFDAGMLIIPLGDGVGFDVQPVPSHVLAQVAIVKRNQLLVASDWTDLNSAPGRLGEDLYLQWQAYRQALRDITLQPLFPAAIDWPLAPGSN